MWNKFNNGAQLCANDQATQYICTIPSDNKSDLRATDLNTATSHTSNNIAGYYAVINPFSLQPAMGLQKRWQKAKQHANNKSA